MCISELIFHILFWSIPHYWTTTSHYPVPFIPFVNTIANRDIWSTRHGGFVLRMIRVLQGWIYHRKFRIFELQLTRWIGTIFNFMLFSCKWQFWCKAVSPYIPCNTLKELEKVDSVVSPSLWWHCQPELCHFMSFSGSIFYFVSFESSLSTRTLKTVSFQQLSCDYSLV